VGEFVSELQTSEIPEGIMKHSVDHVVSDQKVGTQANVYQPPNTTSNQTLIIKNREMGANVHDASSHMLVKVCLIHRALQVQVDIEDE
jgi:hypothetical protein